MKRTLILFLCLAAVSLAGDQPADPVVTKDTVFTFYRSFKRLTSQPRLVAPLTAALCGAPSPALVAQEKRATGPHYQTSIHLYANPSAAETISRRFTAFPPVFPPGSVIIKEKLAEDGLGVTGVGGMVKRAPGFDAKNGDWEYFYSDKNASFSMGRMQNCADCHARAKATDYVYSVWQPAG